MLKRFFPVLMLSCAVSLMVQAAETFITFTPETNTIPLASGTISYSESDYEGVKIAIRSLQADMERVLGVKPQLSTLRSPLSTILIGTVGKNKDIDALKLPDLKGKREKFIITTRGDQLVIAGSDRRGTIYGIYELSRQLGVSPWPLSCS